MANNNDALLTKIRRARTALDELPKTQGKKKKDEKNPLTERQLLKIQEQKEALDAQIQRVIEINIQQRGEEYDEVTQSLDAASDKMEKALEDLSKLSNALQAIGGALDLLMKFKPT